MSVEKVKKILDDFSEKCEQKKSAEGIDILGDEEDMSAIASAYGKGISLAPEPDFIMVLNKRMDKSDRKYDSKAYKSQCGSKLNNEFSYTSFVIQMLMLSGAIANKRLGRPEDAEINIEDDKTYTEIKKVFDELVFLCGIDPETMMESEVQGLLKKGNKEEKKTGTIQKTEAIRKNVKQEVKKTEKKSEKTVKKTEKKTQVNIIRDPETFFKNFNGGISIPLRTGYESQNTNNCYACSGTALLNQYLANKKNLKPGEKVNTYKQEHMRNINVDDYIRPYEEVSQQFSSEAHYLREVKKIKKCFGPGSSEYNEIFELGDFFFKADTDMVLNKKTYGVDYNNKITLNAQKKDFASQIENVLKTGNLVSLYKGTKRHFITVTGIKGNVVEYYDSMKDVSKPLYATVDSVFTMAEGGRNISLTWLSKMGKPEDLVKDYDYIGYNGKEFYTKNDVNNVTFNLLHKNGVMGNKALANGISSQVYVPKNKNINKPKARPNANAGNVNANAQKLNLKKGTAKKETVKKDTVKKDTAEKVIIEKETEKKGTVKKEAVKKEIAKKDTEEKRNEVNNISSPEMKAYGADAKALYNFLGQKMPPLNYDSEAIDSGCLMAVTLYNRLIERINACLAKPSCFNNSVDARKQLEFTLNQCREESQIFRQKVFEYREMLATSKGKKSLSWYDALHYERAVVYNLDGKNGVTMKKMGDGTSVVYKLIKKKEGAVYFKKEGKIPTQDNKKLVRDFYNTLDVDENYKKKVLKPIFDGIFMDADKGEMKGGFPFAPFLEFNCKKEGEGFILELIKNESHAAKQLEKYKKFSKDEKKKLEDVFNDFSKYVFTRQLGNNVAKIKSDRNLTDRNVATSRMAEFLGIQDMVADSRTAYVKKQDGVIKGNLMEDTRGKNSDELYKEGKTLNYTPKAVSELFSLQIFDIICGQIDRHQGNFHLIGRTKGDNMTVTGVRALDNELAFGEVRYAAIKDYGLNSMRAPSEINLKGMPLSFLNRVMLLDRNTLNYLLCDIVNKDEMDCMWDRVKGLKEDIKKLPGLVFDNKTGKYHYSDPEDNDDELRQAKQLKEIWKNNYGKKLDVNTVFSFPALDEAKIDQMIKKRSDELKKSGKTKM